MTPTTVSGSVSVLPFVAVGSKAAPVQDDKRGDASRGGVSQEARVPVPGATDTVSISSQTRQTIADIRKEEEDRRQEARKEEAAAVADKTEQTVARVQFVYNPDGVLSIRYMDTSNRLIYQVPSELMLRMKETASNSDTSVDTKA